jgi:hypothetical protein
MILIFLRSPQVNGAAPVPRRGKQVVTFIFMFPAVAGPKLAAPAKAGNQILHQAGAANTPQHIPAGPEVPPAGSSARTAARPSQFLAETCNQFLERVVWKFVPWPGLF